MGEDVQIRLKAQTMLQYIIQCSFNIREHCLRTMDIDTWFIPNVKYICLDNLSSNNLVSTTLFLAFADNQPSSVKINGLLWRPYTALVSFVLYTRAKVEYDSSLHCIYQRSMFYFISVFLGIRSCHQIFYN